MKDILKLVLSLGVTCLLGGAALTWVCAITAKPIAEAEKKALMGNLKLVLPEETTSTELISTKDGVLLFVAKDGKGEIVGYAAEAVGKGGFGGDMKVLTGLNPDGSVRLVRVTDHKETPGIGTKVTDRKVQRTIWDFFLAQKMGKNITPPNEYLDKFAGKRMTKGEKSVEAIGGATRSSKAVKSAVKKGCNAFRQYQQEAK